MLQVVLLQRFKPATAFRIWKIISTAFLVLLIIIIASSFLK